MQQKIIDRYPELREKIVLNVDDNEMNQLVITKILKNSGVNTVVAYNGAEAVEKLNEGLKPDVILMDLEMPVMNGLQASEFIRKQIKSSIPIIINTGNVSAYQKYKLKLIGVQDYLEKPYTTNDILGKISKNIAFVAV